MMAARKEMVGPAASEALWFVAFAHAALEGQAEHAKHLQTEERNAAALVGLSAEQHSALGYATQAAAADAAGRRGEALKHWAQAANDTGCAHPFGRWVLALFPADIRTP